MDTNLAWHRAIGVIGEKRLTCFQVPDNYLRSIFGSYLASRFVYEHGSSPSQFAFFEL